MTTFDFEQAFDNADTAYNRIKMEEAEREPVRTSRLRVFWNDHKDDILTFGTIAASAAGIAAVAITAKAKEEQQLADYIEDMKRDVRDQERYIASMEDELAEIRMRKAARAERRAARKARRRS